MKKWNEQAAPNNNLKSSDIAPGSEQASEMSIKGVSQEEASHIKTENEVRRQNL
ncbi:hypothetical protein [Peribacillus cavernae]|uniref:hypothetical protein n=1 Tax=Peribacillus cavernae TaxID=1674310 RepID=UPI00163C1D1C|nr:hypothetical protein [Peribacillus cavernae]MDQ0217792.1 hypothetical protein [Peribacillus cavernae]